MANLEANRWSCVVAGRWNPAILTPKGIATHIFKKEGEIPLEVLVPLDAQGPPLIRIEGLNVAASFKRLAMDCEKSNLESLDNARKYCCNAIDALPLTPLTAAGFNLRFDLNEPDDEFINSLKLPLDDKISEQQLTIEGREIHRSVQWNNGLINIQVARIKADSYNILLNFDKQSADRDELKNWLSVPIDDVKSITETILCLILNICGENEIECLTQKNQ